MNEELHRRGITPRRGYSAFYRHLARFYEHLQEHDEALVRFWTVFGNEEKVAELAAAAAEANASARDAWLKGHRQVVA